MPIPPRDMIWRTRWVGVVVSLAAVAAVGAIALSGRDDRGAQAQQLVPPPFPAIIFNGNVTINGETPAYSGFVINARIGEKWKSPPVVVGSLPENLHNTHT